jgi:hypothetical protein
MHPQKENDALETGEALLGAAPASPLTACAVAVIS